MRHNIKGVCKIYYEEEGWGWISIEGEDGPTLTIEQAKARVNHLIELAKAGEAAQGETFEILKNESKTAKIVVNGRKNHIEVFYELEDTDSGLLDSKDTVTLPKGISKDVAKYIIDTF